MKNKHIGLLVLLITLSAFTLVKGQKLFPDTLPNTLPDRFRIVLDMDSVSFYTKHKKEAKANLDNSLLYLNQFSKKDIFESGTIAYNYEIIENYLNEIVKKITPKELIEKYNIHVYPSKETEINAYAMYDGSIMFNIHNFIYLNNEAEVAHILAHEVGHQIQEYNATDEWLAYMNSGIFSDKKRKFEKASQNAEIDADYKAAIMLTASGYNNEAGISVEELFLKLETNLKNYKGYHSRNYLKTHPPSKNRLDSLKTWIIDLNGGSNYLVDSILFNKIKDESRLHSLKYSLETHNYFNCLEIAFEGYLAEGKENYAYYIAESGRRLLYTNKLKINNIMFSNYYKGMVDKNFIDIINKKIYLTPASDSIISYLKNQRLYVTKNFFDFFFNVVTEENNKEILLTKGLYEYNKSKGKKTNYLNNYVLKNGTYSKFINELLNPI
ncbi:MAG: M48 family metallopeptidase, partial [Flavobacteriales bacterium]|nr:M48 family metallopeptidase [Flavobacteriales bacterium]